MNRLVRGLVLALLVGGALAGAFFTFAPTRVEGPVVEITALDFLKSDDPAPPAADAAWVGRTLPDNWRRSNPGQSGYGWYRATFRLAQAPGEAWAAYLPTVATTHQLSINGTDVGGGAMTGPYSRALGKPQFNAIAAHLLRAGDNELLLRLRVAPNLRGGLGPITLGPRAVVAPLYERDLLLRVSLPRSMNMALVFVGLLVLLLWLRRPTESIYGIFAALALVWSLRNFHYTASPAIPSALWEAFVLGSLGVVVVLNWIFMRRYTGAPPRRAEWVLAAGAVLSMAAFALLDPAVVSALRLPWYVGCAAFGAWAVAILVRHLRATRGRREAGPWVILGALVITLLLGVTDLAVSAQVLPFGPAARMAYGAPVLLCALVYALAEDYFRTYDEARARNADLERRVQERAQELERTHQQLRALERAATVAAERDRLMRDMHDGIGSQLITTLEAVERGRSGPADVAALLRECMDDLRLMIDSLEPDERSLQIALANLRYRLEPRLRAAGVALEWDVADGMNLPSPGAVLHVLRIVQEAVGNALKHAGASRLRVAGRMETGFLVLEVADDGCGLAPRARPADAPAGRGLGNMQARARQLAGTLEQAARGPGTTWILRVPAGGA
ncbi:MAG: hypothetical protein EOO30_16015 [Comamonadaceae bacterium]|nr:MAG: hypothetical protein EOO30_16015 [Comamonadaceae bacterium]